MAKKKRGKSKKGGVVAMSLGPSRNRVNASIEEAENGFVVNTTGHGKDGYHDKTHVAPTGRAALRIATGHLTTLTGNKLGKKKLGKKFAPLKA